MSLICPELIHSFQLKKTSHILENYAPLEMIQEGQLALKQDSWTSSSLSMKNINPGPSVACLKEEAASCSLPPSLDYILSQDHIPQKEKKRKNFSNPFYVSLCHVEEWAASEGFRPVERNLQQQGIIYWKEGQHFSKAQLLMHINQIRLEKRLQPLSCYEDELTLYAEGPSG